MMRWMKNMRKISLDGLSARELQSVMSFVDKTSNVLTRRAFGSVSGSALVTFDEMLEWSQFATDDDPDFPWNVTKKNLGAILDTIGLKESMMFKGVDISV